MALAPLFAALPGVLRLFGRIIGGDKGKKMEEVGGTIDEVSNQLSEGKLPTEQQVALRSVIMEHEEKLKQIALEKYRLDVQDLKEARDVIKTTLRSEDPYVRRARPTFLWLIYVIFTVNYVIVPILWVLGVAEEPFVALPTALFTLFGTAYLGYGALRSADKKGIGIGDIGTLIKKIAGPKR